MGMVRDTARELSSGMRRERPSRHDDGDLLPTVFAIDTEMRVEGEDAGTGIQLGEPDKARVGERHGQVFVFADQLPERIAFPEHREINFEHSRPEEIEKATRAVGLPRDEKERLRQDGLGGEKRRGQFRKLRRRPRMRCFRLPQKSDERAGIDESPWTTHRIPSCAPDSWRDRMDRL